jgi:hypothetical protein
MYSNVGRVANLSRLATLNDHKEFAEFLRITIAKLKG